MIKEIEKLTNTFFEKLKVDIDEINIIEEGNNIFMINIKTPDSNIIIGPHGKTLDALKSIIRLLILKKTEKRIVLHLEINDYLKSKQDRLFSFIKSKINSLEGEGDEVILPFMTSYERKKVHSFISENYSDVVSTKSIGEAKDRRMHLISKKAKVTKNSKLSLDIDGDDI